MDDRKLNTRQVLAAGILNKPTPETRAPGDVEYQSVDECEWSQESLIEGLKKGALEASMYYGCWRIWKAGEFYNGELLQYRSVTDSFEGQSFEFAIDKAVEWANGCWG